VYNFLVTQFRFYHPIEVRYGDLDPQGHVNNAKYLTYLEQGRVAYVKHLGLWKGGSFFDFGIILADIQITYRAPIQFGQPVRVWVRVSRLGNKSLTMDYRIDEGNGGVEFASSTSVLVAYSYHDAQTRPIPDEWREIIRDFEGLSEQQVE
jgi:acyl-CoA thioester hydrolase